MLLGRRFDERMLILQRQGKIGTFAPVKGQEAQVGAAAALNPEDWIVPSFREAPVEIWRGKPMESILLYYSGYNEGGSHTGGTEPASRIRSCRLANDSCGRNRLRDEVPGAKNGRSDFFWRRGDLPGRFPRSYEFCLGLSDPGHFHMSEQPLGDITAQEAGKPIQELWLKKRLPTTCPGLQVDGNDVLAVYKAAKEAVDRARSGRGTDSYRNGDLPALHAHYSGRSEKVPHRRGSQQNGRNATPSPGLKNT